jgi:hypothetical protein
VKVRTGFSFGVLRAASASAESAASSVSKASTAAFPASQSEGAEPREQVGDALGVPRALAHEADKSGLRLARGLKKGARG